MWEHWGTWEANLQFGEEKKRKNKVRKPKTKVGNTLIINSLEYFDDLSKFQSFSFS